MVIPSILLLLFFSGSPSSSIFLLMPDFSISIFISCIPPQAVTFLSLYSCANIINQNKSICLKNLYCKIWVQKFWKFLEEKVIEGMDPWTKLKKLKNLI